MRERERDSVRVRERKTVYTVCVRERDTRQRVLLCMWENIRWCACVCDRKKKREKERKRERDSVCVRERDSVCV